MSLVHHHDVVLNTLNIHRSNLASFWWGRVNRNQCLGVIYARCCWDSCMSYCSVFSMLQCVCVWVYIYTVYPFLNILIFYLFFCHTAWHVGSWLPDQGSDSCPLQWKDGVLTTGHRESPGTLYSDLTRKISFLIPLVPLFVFPHIGNQGFQQQVNIIFFINYTTCKIVS